MGLDAIVEEIKAKGRAEADRINQETEKEVSRILSDAESQAARIRTTRKDAAKKEIERLKLQELSSANLEVKRAMLNARKELLDEVNEKAKEGISRIPAEMNQKLLRSIIEKNQANNSRISSNRKDEPDVRKLSKLKYSGDINCIGGVIIENETGTEYLDLRYETILKKVSESSLKQVSDILFG